MKAAHGRKRWLVQVVGAVLWLLAAVGSGFVGMGTLAYPAQASEHLSKAWVNGDQSGSLIGLDPEGRPTQAFSLKHTDVSIQVSGPLARAQVTQQFENPYSDKIEAVYTFSLPQQAAVVRRPWYEPGHLIFLFLHVFDRNLSYVETLPNGSDGILRNEWIRGQDGEFMLDGLANEHAVKRVFVKSREFGQVSGWGFFQGECANAMALPLLRDELIHRCGEGNFAKRVFHENFPDGNRTQQYFMRGVGKYLPTHRRKSLVV